jgi:hypothetical protein
VASLDSRLRRLEEVAFQQEVDQEMARWEPVHQALGFPADMRPFLRQGQENWLRWQKTYGPVPEELLEEKIRQAAEQTAAQYGVSVEEVITEAERIARIAKEFGVV